MALYQKFNGNFEEFRYAVVFDSEGKPTPINRFWKDTTAILVFLRHFGCAACRGHAFDIWSHRESLQKDGGQIIFIGNGAINFIDGFRKEMNLGDAKIFTDPTLKAFRLGGFNHSLIKLASPKSAINLGKLMVQGFRNSNPLKVGQGSNRQMGGVVVVNSQNQVVYHYVSEALGDTPKSEDIQTGSPSAIETKKIA
jgi:hypothetical protein